ncbi:phospholipase D family protein [Ruminococcus flavefaciens]|uniref:phospholipase D family protein n=1 Tax=Ruminococcus flavefaciens TaxID=1265 RepID=UPI0026EA8F30|nr:phospholipase D family protein [Ruminococcus flavefaciens]
MLEPEKERIDYGQLLSCPEGYKLDIAIGTTYSLDLDALVGISLALGLGASTDSDLMGSEICILEALELTAENVALFCEGGQIHTPNNHSSLYILLEKMVYQVITKKTKGMSHYPSFHPKFWLLRFVSEKNGSSFYRLAIMSRNLTFDQSWDVTFSMEGVRTPGRSDKNVPVSDLINYLLESLPENQSTEEKRRKIKTVLKDMPYVEFKLDCKEFTDFEFIPLGIKRSSGGRYNIKDAQYPLFNKRADELLVITPFLSKGVIRDLNENTCGDRTKNILITRTESLSKLSAEDCGNFSLYTLRDQVIDGESIISDEDSNISKHDIHAKLYMIRKGSRSELYLGSMNASHSAVNGNIEFMIRLISQRRYLDLDKMKAALFTTDAGDSPFTEAELTFCDEPGNSPQLDKYIKEICRCSHHADAERSGDNYRLTLFFDELPELPEDIEMEISPLLLNRKATIANRVVFDNVELKKLSAFYSITVTSDEDSVSRVLKISTEGIPEDREKKLISDIINDKSSFYRYIAFLLGENYVSSYMDAENIVLEENQNGSEIKKPVMLPPIYELMLKKAYTSPERLKAIGRLIDSVADKNVIPEFEELYNTFKKAVKLK